MASDSAASITCEATDTGVSIHWPQENICFQHSFVVGELARRAKQPNQGVLKACSNRKNTISSVLDLTGGWGQDSLILATHGKEVTFVEKNNTVFEVVKQSLRVLSETQPDHQLLRHLSIVHSNAVDFLARPDIPLFDCIYLDPMFPAHKSGAKPSKSLQLLQQLTDNEDIDSVFLMALQRAGNRVVVKRPLKASFLTDREPELSVREKTIRFDVYLTGSP